MGGLCPERQHDICLFMAGLNNTGKTTILYQLKFQQQIKTAPTNGFNMESINISGRTLTIWEVGGQVALRRFWQYHYEDKDGIIFVVDASHRTNLRAVHD
jgi:small GTP-binding protein